MLKLNHSQQKVVATLVENGPLTRREICSLAELSWAAVSKTVLHLQNCKILIRGEERDITLRGRRPDIISMNSEARVFGVSINRGILKAVALNLGGEIVDSDSAMLADGDDPVPEAVKLLSKLMKRLNGAPVFALGVSFPGLIGIEKKSVEFSVNFPGFVERQVAEEFRLALDLDFPVFVERNAVCDLTRIVTNRTISGDSMLISLHSGVSAAVFIDGQILHGKSGNIGELGHLKLEKGDIPCACGGVGCLETMVGGLAWQRKYNRIRRKIDGAPARFADALASGMPEAVSILRETLTHLCPVLSELAMLLRPESIVFSADVPESVALVFSTVIEERFHGDHPEVSLAEPFVTAAGAAALGLLWLGGNSHYK
ncbi:MAG: ROK family protein [Victivallales bacterium]|nr:ROK family protein [Victivallales bacterium]